jgi:hypothetical protein
MSGDGVNKRRQHRRRHVTGRTSAAEVRPVTYRSLEVQGQLALIITV